MRQLVGCAVVLGCAWVAAAQEMPKDGNRWYEAGRQAYRGGKLDLAIENFQKAIELVPAGSHEAAILWGDLGSAYLAKQDLDNAIVSFGKSEEIEPDDARILGYRAWALERAGRKDEAIEEYEAAIEVNPSDTVALNNVAFLLAENDDDLDDALGYALRAKKLEPDDDEIADTLGWVYLRRSEADDAIRVYRALEARKPGQADFHYKLALGLEEKGDRSGALAEVDAALKCRPADQDAVKLTSLRHRLTN